MNSFTKHVAVYTLAGPPLAAIATIFLTSIFTGATDGGSWTAPLPSLGAMAIFAVPFSYMIGGAQALFTGLGSAMWQRSRGPVPLALPLALSFVAWICFSFVGWFTNGSNHSLGAAMFSQSGAFWLANHLFAGGICWWLCRRWTV